MVQNTARPRGRPRNFDEAEALEKATQVYWSKGYDAVTIDDLVAGMANWVERAATSLVSSFARCRAG
jgi:hypothetical protein